MKTNQFIFAAFTAAFLSVANYAAAQVTIGGSDLPKAGTIVDLNPQNGVKGGLLLSNVELTSLTAIPATFPNAGAISTPTEKQALAGMIVWNANDYLIPNGDGLYLWDGSKWNYWGGSDGVDILTSGGLPTGSGTFSGKRCFDIATTGNDDINSCGTTAVRTFQKTDFIDRTSQDGVSAAPYSGVQEYTFTPFGTVNNVRFYFSETVGGGHIVDSIVPNTNYSGSITSGTKCKVKVYYKESLQSTLLNKTRDQAFKLKLYAVYNDGSADRVLELNTSFQDCSCCGAYTKAAASSDIVWRAFMCHNLGANQAADPFTPAAEIHGAKYKWGVSNAAVTQAQDQDPAYKSSVPDWTNITKPPTTSADWNMTSANPCPDGWRVPTKEEWTAVINTSNNAITKVGTNWSSVNNNYTTGMQVGDALFLPAAGGRDTSGKLYYAPGTDSYYWSTVASGTSSGNTLHFYETNQKTDFVLTRSHGLSVRCISKK
ncbi:MAG: fibrobacter succinogenes major paralogous domain-containing protein [Prevotellaceae bacterium]|jgi:uncharacterized protein (TIGR02145 family)|nr:fibrobacter succinogenes major paralogous domain-containing protein [Prevotellaceae bacterium]